MMLPKTSETTRKAPTKVFLIETETLQQREEDCQIMEANAPTTLRINGKTNDSSQLRTAFERLSEHDRVESEKRYD